MSYYVEDHENGTLRANGKGGPPRTDKQPLVIANTLKSQAGKGGSGIGPEHTFVAAPLSHVRRLTPRECERLQALPDDWTAHGPDSRRYAALGDAVTASVGEWIGRRLLEAT